MRAMTTAAANALSGGLGRSGALLVEMDFAPVLRVTTWGVDIDWGGFTWTGIGTLGSVDPVKDSNLTTGDLKFTLSGVPAGNIALALGGSVRDTIAKTYLAILDPDTQAVLDAPMIWSGVLDQMPISEDGKTSSIGASAKHIGSLFSRVKAIRYTAADQQKISPGDTSLRFIPSQSQHKDTWPAAAFFRQ
jgi:hypothetical protein